MSRYLDIKPPAGRADRLFRELERQIAANEGNLISMGADRMTVELCSGHLRDIVEKLRAETEWHDPDSRLRAGATPAGGEEGR